VWSAPAGGDSTPAVRGDLVVTQSFSAETGLVAFRISAEKAEKLWNLPYQGDVLRTQSSPVIVGQQVFLFDDNNHYCVDIDTGKKVWSSKSQSTISSPAAADGKLFALTNNGNTLLMMATGTPEAVELGRANVRAQWVPSPCIADGRLILRMSDKVKAWNLAKR
jgi:outer membrane protein assembly factor BamB